MDKGTGGNWKRFQRLRFSAKNVGQHMQRAESMTTKHARKFIFQRLSSVRESRREIILWLAIVVVMIAGVLIQLTWFGGNYLTTTAAIGGTYSEASRGPVSTLNPLYATSDAELSASRLLFSSLYTYDTTGHLTEDLATDMSVDKTGKVYTVNIRSDATWTDDAKVTAADIVFTINLIKNPNTRSTLEVNWRDVSVKALDADTVEFTLPAGYAAFPNALTFPILPQHTLKDVSPGVLRQNGFSTSPVGSGPFAFSRMRNEEGSKDDKIIHLKANETYYKGAPKLHHFDMHVFTKKTELTRALAAGEVNAAANIDPELAKKKLPSDKFRTVHQPTSSGVYALFNTQNNILSDKNVRLALRYAINTDALRASIPGEPKSLYLPFVDGQIGDTSDIDQPEYNREKAIKMLTDAGWALNGDTRKKKDQILHLSITTIKDTTYERVAKSLAKSWQSIGVHVEVTVIDTEQPNSSFVQTILQPRNFDVLLYQLEIGADPDVYAYWASTQAQSDGYNFTSYNNAVADANLSSARASDSRDKRDIKYHAFADQWLQDAPAIGLYQGVATYATTKSTTSVDSSSKLVTAEDRYANVLYWSPSREIVYKTP